MPVIARIPRLDADRIAAHDGDDVADGDVAGGTSENVPPPPCPIDPRRPPPGRSPRRQRRFPIATTLLLAVAAAACWSAVWRQERQPDAAGPASMADVPEPTPERGGE